MQVLRLLAQELIAMSDAGLEPLSASNDLRDKLKAACDEHYKAEMKYHEVLRDLIAETAKRIDAKLAP